VALPADELVDAVVVALTTTPPTPPTGSTVTVAAADVPEIDPDKLPAGDLRVWVYWQDYDPGTPDSRGSDQQDITVTVVAVERYTAAGAVPLAWRRERSEWFQAFAVAKLNDPRVAVGGYYADSAERVSFDREQLTNKLFWASFTVTLRGGD
jgi:hypothetical protein